MNEFQFEKLINKLDEINSNLNNKNNLNIDNDLINIVLLIKEKFFEKLEIRTGWGRNQIKDTFNEIINEVIK